ncbi:MAG: endonuclease [Paenibacillus sp.]|nr:endonuclease [Paenibacillus sp.]
MGNENKSLFVGGLLSVTFRKLQVKEIVELTAKSGLQLIEWGGDIHVPPGDIAVAKETARMTADAGLQVSGYASYYRVGDEPEGMFERTLDSALALGATSVRVWAGRLGSAKVDAEGRRRVVEDARRIAELAAAGGATIEFEFHNNTLTDTVDSTVQLLEEIGSPHVRSCWQAPLRESVDSRGAGLRRVLPWLSTIHTFQLNGSERMPLQTGAEEWRTYLDLARTTGRRHNVLLEFVREDDPQQFLRDAAALREWLDAYNRIV